MKAAETATSLFTRDQCDLWPSIDDAAYHGLAGDVVCAFAPHTEADPVAILIQLLSYFGNIVGIPLLMKSAAHWNLQGVLA